MDKEKLEYYKRKLLTLKTQILNGGILRSTEDLHVSPDDLADESDLAATVINQQVTFTMRNRQMETLKAIEIALQNIEFGTYGNCEECDTPIGEKRLENQPWATLCIDHAEELELQQAAQMRNAV